MSKIWKKTINQLNSRGENYYKAMSCHLTSNLQYKFFHFENIIPYSYIMHVSSNMIEYSSTCKFFINVFKRCKDIYTLKIQNPTWG